MSEHKVYPVPKEFENHTHIRNDQYLAMYDASVNRSDEFWSQKADEFITWFKPWNKLTESDFDQGEAKWFLGAELNASYNCIDRHLELKADHTAIIWEGDDPGDDLRVTYRELHEHVCRLSNVLLDRGVTKGDRVCIYMPMIPEAAYAMLACARIGAVHSVVFGGFSPQALQDRILDSDCRTVITADEGVRGGRPIPLKENTDKALEDCPDVSTVLVVKRTGGKVNWFDERDVWYEEATSQVSPECEAIPMGSEDPLFILYTSGSTGKPKSISVKKEWMKNSANFTAKTFGLKEGDSALLCMPMKYVAGKMMVVRSLELGLNLKVLEPSSNPLERINEKIDFAAMVPLQLENSLDQLGKVKTLIVGGGQINPQLVGKLQSVETQIFETYGMTETLTHVAIKPLNDPNKFDVFQALDGIRFEKDDRGCLVIHAPMLNPKPIVTNDLVKLVDEKSFRWLGRFDNVINSGGVKIIPEVVEVKLASIIPNSRFFIVGFPDESLGEKVVLVVEGDEMEISLDSLEKYKKPKEIYFIPKFVETRTGKVSRRKTMKLID